MPDEEELGRITLLVAEAVFDKRFAQKPLNTYCFIRILEPGKWRLRRSQPWQGDDPFHPQWNASFEVDDVLADSKIVVDIFNKLPDANGKDEFIGKVTLRLAELMREPAAAQHDIGFGTIKLQLSWEGITPDGDLCGAPTWLIPCEEEDAATALSPSAMPSLPPKPSSETAPTKPAPLEPISQLKPLEPMPLEPVAISSPDSPDLKSLDALSQRSQETSEPPSPFPKSSEPSSPLPKVFEPPSPLPKTSEPASSAGATGAMLDSLPSLGKPAAQPIETPTAAMGFDEAESMDEEIEELEEDVDDFEDDDDISLPIDMPATGSDARQATPAARGFSFEMFEYTHRGGSGNGPKENQDAYFIMKIDDNNFAFGVLDGHGGDYGRVASQAATAAMKTFLRDNFTRVRAKPTEVMTECFQVGHDAIYEAVKGQDGVSKDERGLLVADFGEGGDTVELDAVDGGSTASIAVVIDGHQLVYAAVGDSAGILAVPSSRGSAPNVIELIPEHSPTRIDEWSARLCKTPVLVVYNHPDMFEDPSCLLHVFDVDDDSGDWILNTESMRKHDEAGLGFKTERGDRAAVVMTPEDGEYSQMNLNMTRSLGDFYHQRYGVTWKPDVTTKDLREMMGDAHKAVMCVSSDGVWDMWTFEEAMEELCLAIPMNKQAQTDHVDSFFDLSRRKGEEAFGDSADNLTGVVIFISRDQ
mmetsp:Transcript_69798/g.115924  ORF Transcript_69798/g.115924 Transcript_69798/m.115924 type:complete len:698 (+) Transcript_69798:40-2133(+)|eukprot:CAMPEP_0119316316 /NCGR_PEP_ID=MMETSP1333-20130426/39405_1 /TAXON_ID=418940 /ORGANISM="Scyphosphaera apsteinii, Strain RCC1455" /LENGTH=697 /DNA_ID=CAMNT_0007321931 /DNA_START=37 /DNA_END=2130 /DNA_ORIENTATION=+